MQCARSLAEQNLFALWILATVAVKYLKAKGCLEKLDESEEINACTVKIKVDMARRNKNEDWLLLFKNETHNHPTEIEPFGGAATCIGGAIRDPLIGHDRMFTAPCASQAAATRFKGVTLKRLHGKASAKKDRYHRGSTVIPLTAIR